MKPSYGIFLIWLLVLMICLPARTNASEKQDSLRRFALVIGANDGGKSRPKLQYAVSDARALNHLLQQIGGVFSVDCLFLIEPSRENILNGFKVIQDKIQQSKSLANKIEMLFYYSGHSDEEAILLGSEKVAYAEIKQAIEHISADVRIAILDSCSSGAFTQLKGGKMRPPFLMDTSYDMKGFAYLTSSSSDEAAQESDKLKSSFFTHYLLSGLRGAADLTQDGRVTLHEAYQYAYNETLSKTEKTLGGPQHPNYNIQMSGTGDVIMTDIRKSSAIVIFDKSIQGRLFVRDAEDNLVLEMRKPAGRIMQIGLEAATYFITNETAGKLYTTEVSLIVGQEYVLSAQNFKALEPEITASRGEQVDDYQVKTLDAAFLPDKENNYNVIHHVIFHFLGSYSARLDGLSMGLGLGLVGENTRGVQFAGIGNATGGNLEGFQIAGLFNSTDQELKGYQFSGIFNLNFGPMLGVQCAGIFNYANKTLQGVQCAGIFSYAAEKFEGVQCGGIFTYAGQNVSSMQLSGIFNYAKAKVTGVQISGIGNLAEAEISGLQASGIVNTARTCEGVQIGLVNIAQEQKGVPVGLVNLAQNGGIDLLAWRDSLCANNLGVRFRANNFYSIISVGRSAITTLDHDTNSFGFYWGIKLPLLSWIDTNLDLGTVYSDLPPTWTSSGPDQQAVLVRFTLEKAVTFGLSLFGGIGYYYQHEISQEKPEFSDGTFKKLYLGGLLFSF